MPKRTIPDAPENLSTAACKLWRELGPEVATTQGRLVLFRLALESLDLAQEALAVVRAEGMTVKTRTTGASHAHPMLKVATEARREFCRQWKELGLSADISDFDQLMK